MSDHQDIDFADILRRRSERICALILFSDYPKADLALEIGRLREQCAQEAPDKAELFELVYVSRFRRLWDQWRRDED
jgi:hypothetical protein